MSAFQYITAWLLLVLELGLVNSLECRKCSATYYRGEPSRHEPCFDDVSKVSVRNCPANSVANSWYCRTLFTVTEGLAVGVERDCISTYYDYDDTVTGVPTAAKCVRTISYNKMQVKCYYPCETDNCNSVSTINLKQCSNNCSQDALQGYCDYLTGKCVCSDGYTGSNCSMQAQVAPVTRGAKIRCIQCNGETDSNCGATSASLPSGSECLNANDHCFVSKTIILNSNGTTLNTVISRGCTPYASSGYCTVQGAADDLIYGHKAYTCVDVCNSDNCNNEILAATDLESASRLRCVQCKDTAGRGSCENAKETACPIGSNYCYTDVEYFASWSDQGQVTSYTLVKVERGCSSHELRETACTNSSVVGTDLRKISCFESCQANGCNDRWPNRPKCIVCSGKFSVTFANAERCFHTQTTAPLVCDRAVDVCSTNIYTTEVAGAPENFYVEVYRACTPSQQNTTKVVVTGPVTTRHHFYTCSTDRCNSAEHDYKVISNVSTTISTTIAALFSSAASSTLSSSTSVSSTSQATTSSAAATTAVSSSATLSTSSATQTTTVPSSTSTASASTTTRTTYTSSRVSSSTTSSTTTTPPVTPARTTSKIATGQTSSIEASGTNISTSVASAPLTSATSSSSIAPLSTNNAAGSVTAVPTNTAQNASKSVESVRTTSGCSRTNCTQAMILILILFAQLF